MDPNQWHVPMTMRVPLFYEEYHMFNYTLYSMNNDDEMSYLWSIRPDISKEGIYILVEFETDSVTGISDVQHIFVSVHEDYSNVRQHVKTTIQMVYDEPSMLYPDVQEDDEDDETIMQIMKYQVHLTTTMKCSVCIHYLEPLDMGSGEQIDDVIESRPIRLLDWKNAMVGL
ncbi:hypothetical protein M9H77_20939 [Catharanthus roseus]|uniref:Uncharacterized protein n=1 Tax=Catharanthus roseus TaxID=4058 RepID=A0ACC0ALL8_CATRO|nr:hypothetical protein M9H77_20939 [Catharanthus roseus]